MRVDLITRLEGFDYYGDIPMVGLINDDRVEHHLYSDETRDLLDLEINEFDDSCDALLDYGDVDYFDASKCKRLRVYVERRISEGGNEVLIDFYKELLPLVDRAIALNTGIVMEL